MNRLQKVPFTQLKRSELLYLSNGIIKTLEELYDSCSYIKRNCEAIKAIHDKIHAIEFGRGPSERVEEKRVVDAQMDKLLITCRDTLRSNAQLEAFMPEKAAASAILLNIFDKRPSSLYHGSYDNQESQVRKLFAELFDPINDENREQSGISLLFNTLRDTFEPYLQAKVDVYGEKKESSTVNEQLALLRYRLEKVYSFMDGNCFDEILPYVALESDLNANIQFTMARHYENKSSIEHVLIDIPCM